MPPCHATLLAAVCLTFAAGCAPAGRPDPDAAPAAGSPQAEPRLSSETDPDMTPDAPRDTPTARAPVADLPHAQGRTFTTLDAYLDHLKSLAPQDRPWYEEIEPDRFIRHPGGRRAPGTQPDERVYTREELEEMYGFSGAG